jgi:hypothetical protein
MTETKKAPKRAIKTAVVTKLDELEPVAVEEQAAVEPADEDDAAHETITLDDLINRAGAKAVTQEEVNFVTGTRQRFGIGGLVSEFDRRWLKELAAR